MSKNIKRKPKIAMIILAAGSSKRMKAVKQLLPWKKTTLLGYAIEVGVNSYANDVFVVLGANYKNIKERIDSSKVTLINNLKWEGGMGTSISCSLEYLNNKGLIYNAILIIVCDQPLIDVMYINKLIRKFIQTNKNIVASKVNEGIGVPAIFSATYFKPLSELENDYGARKIISENKDDLVLIQEEEKLVDVDTQSDYKVLFRKYGKV